MSTSDRSFTSRTRVALAIARAIAATRGDDNLTATHIAAGIFREGKNAALGALWYAGLSESVIKSMDLILEHSLAESSGPITPRTVAIELTPGEEELIRLAEVEMDRFGHPYLGTEHIFLAILRADKKVADRFAKLGITVDKYEAGLSAALRGDPPPDQSRAV